jgi:16S rRNA (uracil1498-N3)-methyltransferase
MQTFYAPPERFDGDRVTLAGEEYTHAARSCRVRVGETIGVLDGAGRRVEARVESVGSAALVAAVVRDRSGEGEPAAVITVALAMIRPSRFEIAVEQCTGIGVRRIVPLVTERGGQDSRGLNRDRLRRIALEAAKQSGRSHIPVIEEPADIESVCRRDTILLAAETDAELRVSEALARFHSPAEVIVLVGPEGDFTQSETARMAGLGVIPVTLGGLILRAETAATVAAALIVASVPRFNPRPA